MKIAILDDYASVALEYANWAGLGEVTVFRDTLPMGAALIDRLVPFTVLCVMRERTPLPGTLIEALPNLRLIVSSGARNPSIDRASAERAGIALATTRSRKTTTAELTLLLMLALNRQLLPNVASLQAGRWQGPLGRDLAGLTLGLVGLGSVGTQVATLARALGMSVYAWSPNLTAARASEYGVQAVPDLNGLMAQSDVVSLHLVLSERSAGLINARALAAMKPGAVLINTARGGLVDTPALIAGLRAGKPERAALDVFDLEPLPPSDPLLDPDLIRSGKLVLTPHLGYATEATLRLFYTEMAEAVRTWLHNGRVT
ncbi:MAG: NAD(P)-dependent oxidoreductase [Roseinatronobacter sp.]